MSIPSRMAAVSSHLVATPLPDRNKKLAGRENTAMRPDSLAACSPGGAGQGDGRVPLSGCFSGFAAAHRAGQDPLPLSDLDRRETAVEEQDCAAARRQLSSSRIRRKASDSEAFN